MKVVDNADCECVRNGIPCPHDLELAGIGIREWFSKMFHALAEVEARAHYTAPPPRSISLRDILTAGQITKCRNLYQRMGGVACPGSTMEELILPWVPAIEKLLRQEMDPRYLAYLIIHLLSSERN